MGIFCLSDIEQDRNRISMVYIYQIMCGKLESLLGYFSISNSNLLHINERFLVKLFTRAPFRHETKRNNDSSKHTDSRHMVG